MNKYELMFIVKTTMESEEALKIAKGYEKAVSENGGKSTNFKDMGQKKLAYAIKKQINGFYYVINFDGTSATVKELDRRLGLDENIIRHLIVKLDEE